MTNILTNSLETKSYTLFLSSSDKVSGTNNNATFNVNWDSFLPREFDTYKVSFSYQSGGGNYKDSSFYATPASYATGTATILNNLLSITSNTLTAQTFTGNFNIGQQITGYLQSGAAGTLGNPITKTYYITGLGTGTNNGPYTGNPTYYVTNNGETLSLNTFQGNQVFSGVKIVMNSKGRSYSFDSNTTSPSNTLGYAQRDIQTGTSSSNSFSAFYLQFPPKTISRPTEQQITLSFYNLNYPNVLLVDTNTVGTPASSNDMTPWNIILEFTPVLSSQNSSSLGKTQF